MLPVIKSHQKKPCDKIKQKVIKCQIKKKKCLFLKKTLKICERQIKYGVY